jgi:RND superfamily putative drug exporter
MEKAGGWLLRHRGLVGLAWLAITIVGLLAAPSVTGRPQSGVHLNSAAYSANLQIDKHYDGATQNLSVLVLNLPRARLSTPPGCAAR